MTRSGILVLLMVGFGACARRTPPMATAADADRSNSELAELQAGRKLLVGKCTSCHRAPMPSAHTAQEWPAKLAEMSTRAKLDAGQRALIEKYLVVMAER